MKTLRAFAPATVANVAVGFDLMGFALENVGDTIEFTKTPTRGAVEIIGADSFIPKDPKKNTATLGVLQLLKDQKADFGLQMGIQKGIALGSGMGGSAASAVAGVFGANQFLKKKLTRDELFHYAMLGEELASGSAHPDNIAPCLLGGFIYTHSMKPLEYYSIDLPKSVYAVVVHPHIRIDTKTARKILKPYLSLKTFIDQNRMLTGFLMGVHQKNLKLIGHSLQDLVIEPQRSQLIPNFDEMKKAAFKAGAISCSISGSGPSVFALAEGKPSAEKVLKSMTSAYRGGGIDGIISRISKQGARIL